MHTTILLPMAVMVFYMIFIGVMTFFVRLNSVKSGKVSPKYFKTYNIRDGEPPEFVVRMARHYDNMMQLPFLFLITGLTCLHYNLHGFIVVALGWIFVVSRMIHSFVHLGSNHVLKRAGAFGIGWLVILALWIVIMFYGYQMSTAPL